MSFFVASDFSAQNVSRNNTDLTISEDTETRDDLGGTFLGRRAGDANQAEHITAVGFETMQVNQGNDNTTLGFNTGKNNNLGESNVFIGVRAGVNNITGNNNTFLGAHAGLANQNGLNNIYLGTQTGKNTINENMNISIGNFSLDTVHSQYNLSLGHYNKVSEKGDILLGHRIKNKKNGHSNIIIGHQTNLENIDFTNNIEKSIFLNSLGENINISSNNFYNTAFIVNNNFFHSPEKTNIHSETFHFSNNTFYLFLDKYSKNAGFLYHNPETQEKLGYDFLIDDNNDTIEIQHYGKNVFLNNVTIDGTLTTQGLNFKDDLTVKGNLRVNQDVNIDENLYAKKDIHVAKDIRTSNDIFIGNDMIVDSNSVIKGNLDVYETTYLYGESFFLENVEFSNNILCKKEATFLEDIIGEKNTYLKDVFMDFIDCSNAIFDDIETETININDGNIYNLNCSNAFFENQVDFGGKTTFYKDIEVQNNTVIKNDATIHSNLTVKGISDFETTTIFYDKVEFQGDPVFMNPLVFTSDITFEKDIFLNDNTVINASSNTVLELGDIKITDNSLLLQNNVHINNDNYSRFDKGIHIENIILEAENIDILGIHIFPLKSNIDILYPCTFQENSIFQKGLSLENQGILEVKNPSYFKNNAYFPEKIITKESEFSNIEVHDILIRTQLETELSSSNIFRGENTFLGPLYIKKEIDILEEKLKCEKGIISYTDSYFDNIDVYSLNVSNISVQEITIYDRFIQDSSYTQIHDLRVDIQDCEYADINEINSTNAFINNAYIQNIYGSNIDTEEIYIEFADIEHIICDILETSNIYVNNLYSSNTNVDNITVKSGNYDIWEGEKQTVQDLNVNEGTASNFTMNTINTNQINACNIIGDTINATTLILTDINNLNFLEVFEAEVSNLTVYDLAIFNTIETEEGNFQKIYNNHIYTLSNFTSNAIIDDITCLSFTSSNVITDSLTACNATHEIAHVNSNMTVSNNLTVNNEITTGKLVMNGEMETQNINILGNLTFNGDTASFGNRAAFTTIDDILSMTLQNDIIVQRYIYSQHIYYVLGIEKDNNLTLHNNKDQYIIPFHIEKNKKGEHGLVHDKLRGILQCTRGGIYILDIYIETDQNKNAVSTGFMGLFFSDSIIDDITTIDSSSIVFPQNRSSPDSYIKQGHFETFIERDKYVYIISEYNRNKDTQIQYLNTNSFLQDKSFMTVYLQFAIP